MRAERSRPGLEAAAQCARRASHVRDALFRNEADALAAELAARAGDAERARGLRRQDRRHAQTGWPCAGACRHWTPTAFARIAKFGADDDLESEAGRLVATVRAR